MKRIREKFRVWILVIPLEKAGKERKKERKKQGREEEIKEEEKQGRRGGKREQKKGTTIFKVPRKGSELCSHFLKKVYEKGKNIGDEY